MKRKIIQIAVSSEGEDTNPGLTVLCNDGTIWSREQTKRGVWFEIPNVPQPEEAEEPAPKEVSIPPGHRALREEEQLEVGDCCDGYPVSGYMIGYPIGTNLIGRYTRLIK